MVLVLFRRSVTLPAYLKIVLSLYGEVLVVFRRLVNRTANLKNVLLRVVHVNCMSNLFALPKCVLSSVDLMAATVVLLLIVPLWLAGRFLKNVSPLLGSPLMLLLLPTLIGTSLLPKLSTPPLLFTCQKMLLARARILVSMSFLARMAPPLMLQKLNAAWSSCWPIRSIPLPHHVLGE
ncbi:unnamed protein product [Prorocentrum cordatum]|uniref:Uncharacterized protein n=1 Tax=Prorocentrum cordatum TaxID=2364126 RepID=A0ABN9SGP7_9DINO|nr:unnamed protein product [Polarella glacialis]|mmetsp:Transcript_100324/g.269630  ORF Transcript_100324/g.269630 Transcript_100324/m.269630 type:complete len:178 (-) Transcript_100324:732-1265(-)